MGQWRGDGNEMGRRVPDGRVSARDYFMLRVIAFGPLLNQPLEFVLHHIEENDVKVFWHDVLHPKHNVKQQVGEQAYVPLLLTQFSSGNFAFSQSLSGRSKTTRWAARIDEMCFMFGQSVSLR
eukprot:SAG31_NODE_8924_length_1362_cov_5.497229_2_plen_123_part_00